MTDRGGVGAASGSLASLVGTDTDAVRHLISGLAERGWTLATAESLTGGLLTALLTEIPGSSAVVRGGLVVYATELKHVLAGVDAQLLATHGAVHPEVAAGLAVGARDRCGAVLGLGLTGVAGPDPQDGRPPGTFYVAVAGPHPGVPPTVVGSDPDPLPDDDDPLTGRARIRARAVRVALDLVAGILDTQDVGTPTIDRRPPDRGRLPSDTPQRGNAATRPSPGGNVPGTTVAEHQGTVPEHQGRHRR